MADFTEYVRRRPDRNTLCLPFDRMGVGDTFEVVIPDDWRPNQFITSVHHVLRKRAERTGERHGARVVGMGVTVTRIA